MVTNQSTGWFCDSQDLDEMVAVWWASCGGSALPGEDGGTTLFVVEFYDGCRFLGLAEGGVLARLNELMDGEACAESDDFVIAHAGEMAYVVRCVASGLDPERGLELLERLSEAVPDVYEALQEGKIRAPGCCLYGLCPEVQEMTFADWFGWNEKTVPVVNPE